MSALKTEKIIVGEGTEYPLNGLLTLPDCLDGKVPAVVFVHGSGASNMDERIYKLTPFKDLAEGLAERGIASIRYDKRSFVYGRKMALIPTAYSSSATAWGRCWPRASTRRAGTFAASSSWPERPSAWRRSSSGSSGRPDSPEAGS